METIQSAVIQVSADASGVTQGMTEATKAVKDFQQAATTAASGAGKGLADANRQVSESAGSLTREQQRLIAEMGRYSERVGRTRGEVLELRAANLGLTSQLSAQIAAIKAAETAAAAGGRQLNQYGQTAKATAAAMRQLPAQFTDIVVGLQGGQAPLTVLLQQGGQLKDVFGGIAPAFSAIAGYVVGLINPFTVLAAAVGALGVVYFKASQEQDAFVRSIVTTGNFAGQTTRSLNAMAASIDSVVGTRGQASEALAALVGTGQIGGNDLERFATTAVRIQRELGVAVGDTAKQFAALAKEPLRASEQLNESMNYLTLSTYSQIRALVEQGREQEAVALAQRAYADAMDERTARLEANLGIIQRSWRAVSDVAREAWDEILGIGRPDGPGLSASGRGLLASLSAATPATLGGLAGGALRNATADLFKSDSERENEREVQTLARRAAAQEASNAAVQKAGIEAAKAVEKDQERAKGLARVNEELGKYRANLERIRAADANSPLLSPEAIAAGEKAIRDRFKERAGPKPKAFQDDAATRYLLQQREADAALREQLTQTERLTAAQRELAKFNQQIADLKEKRILTADQKSLLAKQDEIRAQLETNVSVSLQVEALKEKARLEKEAAQAAERFKTASDGVVISLLNANAARADRYDRELSNFGRGTTARQRLEEEREIRRENERYVEQLTKQAAREGQLRSPEYLSKLSIAQMALNDALEGSADRYARLDELQGNWINGATRALETYYEQSRNVAAGIEQIFTDAFRGATDALTQFFTTGELDLKKFAASVASNITRQIIETQITGPAANALKGQLQNGTGVGGFIGNIFGNLFGTDGTGGTDAGGAAAGAATLGLATGASAATAALSALAAAAGTASVSLGGSAAASAVSGGGGGGLFSGIGSFFSSLFGRASGGMVEAGKMYQVAENAPEMLSVGNRQYLMMGAQSGMVTPGGAGGGGRRVEFTVVQNFPPGTDRKTTAQAAQDMRGVMSMGERIA